MGSLCEVESWIKAVLHTMSQPSERDTDFPSTGGNGKVEVTKEGISQACLWGIVHGERRTRCQRV